VLSKINNEQRIPSLDGWRAIAISLVLYRHLEYTNPSAWSKVVFDWGGLGVFVFFVISGYLITFLLKRERERTDSVSLKGFYIRRVFRIFPPLLFFLGGVGILARLGLADASTRSILFSLGFLRNFVPGPYRILHHLWSLSVEEQFYLLWPAVLLFARTRRAILIAAGVVLLAPVVRVGEWELLRQYGEGIGHRFETIADAIAIGCVLAGARPALHRTRWYPRLLASPLFVAVPVIAVHDHPLVNFAAGMTVTHIAIALCLDWCVTFHEGRVGRVLNATPLVFVGWLSYSLYLWQQPFLNRGSASPLAAFPVNIIIVVLLALTSYFLVERPALALRQRVERARRHGRDAPVSAPALAPAEAAPRP
jgi:peptidoglycan/LPS O-acetylase OafA/YrhL